MKYFITTAIDYTNGDPHIGHAYEKILADVIARYHRAFDGPTFLFDRVSISMDKKCNRRLRSVGSSLWSLRRQVTEKFLALWDKLGIQKDGWAATTDPRHQRTVQQGPAVALR